MPKFKAGDIIQRVRINKGLVHTSDTQPLGFIAEVGGLAKRICPEWGTGYGVGDGWLAFDCDYELYIPNLENE